MAKKINCEEVYLTCEHCGVDCETTHLMINPCMYELQNVIELEYICAKCNNLLKGDI